MANTIVMQIRYLIYALTEPDSNEIRYVGKSSHGLQRPRRHWTHRQTRERNDYCHKWVRSILAQDKLPGIIVLEYLESGDDIKQRLNAAESAWIKKLRVEGCKLTNLTDGGDGIVSPIPADIRQSISIACKASYERGRIPWTKLHGHNEEARAKISAASKGHVCSQAAREKCSATLSKYYKDYPQLGRVVLDGEGNAYVSLEAASRQLGIPTTTLRRRMKKMGMRFADEV